MKLYLRYSEDIHKDIEKGHSFHYIGLDKDYTVEEVASACNIDESDIEYNEEAKQYVQVLSGLCAFEMESDNLEDAIEEAKEFTYNSVYNSQDMPFWHILSGDYCGDCPEGECIDNVELLYSNNYEK